MGRNPYGLLEMMDGQEPIEVLFGTVQYLVLYAFERFSEREAIAFMNKDHCPVKIFVSNQALSENRNDISIHIDADLTEIKFVINLPSTLTSFCSIPEYCHYLLIVKIL